MTDIGVYVLHWDDGDGQGATLTRRCLRSLMPEARKLGAAVTVIDNGSVEPFATKMQGVQVHRLEANLPLIEAFNVGMKANPAGVLICVTNDTRKITKTPLLEGLANVLQDKSVGVAAPGTNDRGGGILWVGQPLAQRDTNTAHVDNVVWAFRWDVVEAVGWPDCEGHTHRACWYSNKEFCWRARQAGYRVVAARGSAYVEHAHQGGQDRDAHAAGVEWLKYRGIYEAVQ